MGSAALVLSGACSQDLNVTNPNNPDRARAYATPADVQTLATSSVNSWYVNSTQRDPWVMFNVTGDLETMNYGNFGARFNNLEPRIPYNNNAANNDIEVSQVPWEGAYGTLSESNDVLTALKGGMVLPGGTQKYKTLAQFTQAASMMQLALVFDSAYVVDENTDLSSVKFKPYAEVRDSALAKLDLVIAATNAGGGADTANYSQAEFPLIGNFTGARMNQIANTMAAQLLAYTPRTKAEAATVDWNRVLAYANKGITSDFVVNGDGNIWWSEFMGYFDLPSWMRVDQKLIHKMSPNVPDHFNGTYVAPADPHDARLQIDQSGDAHTSGADFVYAGNVIGAASRGIYMQSPYIHERYMDVSWESNTPFLGPMPYTLKAENDLLKAEAYVQTGQGALAAPLINNTYATRGGFAPLTGAEGKDSLLTVIEYEREVELDATNGFGFFALRHQDDLQVGTVRHLPVPATELETVGKTVYTYGGATQDPSGMNIFSGGARPLASYGTQPLALSLALNPRPGMKKSIMLPNGRVMQIAPPIVRHAPRRVGQQ